MTIELTFETFETFEGSHNAAFRTFACALKFLKRQLTTQFTILKHYGAEF